MDWEAWGKIWIQELHDLIYFIKKALFDCCFEKENTDPQGEAESVAAY